MKTKLLITLVFLILIVKKSFSQVYIPMLNNSTWNIVSASFGGSQNFVINPGIDIVIGSYTYKKFIDPTTSSDVFLREDVAAKKVYRNVSGVDQILYDFSLQLSNSIYLGYGGIYKVVSITNVNVNGGTRRKFVLDNGFLSETWIEGVGSDINPLRPYYEMPTDPYIYLTCSAQNGVNIYNAGIANGQPTPTDCSMLLSVEDIKFLTQEIIFSPNPFKTELLITTTFNFDNSKLKIFDSNGKLVKEVNGINGQNIIIKRENLNKGVYFVELTQNGKVISNHKIIID